MTYLVNFRRGFRDASIDVNSQTIICDFEVAKQLFKKIPGFQGFIRAEPVYNFGTDNLPGLAGMDFRLFYGVRGAVSKPSLLLYTSQLKKRYQDPPPKPKQQDPHKGKKKDPKGNTSAPSNSAPTSPGDEKKEPSKDDPVGGPSADSEKSVQGNLISQATPTSADVIPCSAAIPEATVPMHGFITESEKEVSDANLISGLARPKDNLN